MPVCFAQFPSNDATWELKKEDQFNNYISSDWHLTYPWGNTNNGAEFNDPLNLMFSNGWLKIKSDKFIPPWTDPVTLRTFNYNGGCLWSKFKYKYGYFEASIKTPVGKGYWPAFWLWDATADPCAYYDEIDIHERGGDVSETNYTTTQSHHWRVSCQRLHNTNIYSGINNCINPHTYSLFWQPGRMTYLIDNSVVHAMNDQVNTPSNPQAIILNFAIDPWTSPNNLTVFPNNFEIDYIKIYQLKTDCTKAEVICNFSKPLYDLKVKKDINIGGLSCITTINTSDAIAFWAKDYIILDKNTSIVNNGSGYVSFNTYNCSN